jgi:O-antigen/teichoic acid export membrane protein
MLHKIRNTYQSDFFRHNVVFFIGSLVVAVLNYLYHPIISRLLSVEEFGEVQVLFSILAQVSIPLSIGSLMALNLFANKHTEHSTEVKQVSLLMAYVTGGIALALIFFAPALRESLTLSSSVGIVLVAFAVLLSFFSLFAQSGLQATHRFGQVSAVNALTAGGKLLGAFALVSVGYGVYGAMGGFIIANCIALVYAWHVAPNFRSIPTFGRLTLTPELRRELRYGLVVLAGTGYITFMTTADTVFVKYFFDPETAGYYAGVSIVARIIFFGTSSIAGVLLAHVALRATRSENLRVLTQGLALTALLGGIGVALFSAFPHFITRLFLGQTYDTMAHLLPALALMVCIVSLTNVCVSYSIALRDTTLITVSILGIISTGILMVVLPTTPLGFVYSFLGGSILTLIYMVYDIYAKHKLPKP